MAEQAQTQAQAQAQAQTQAPAPPVGGGAAPEPIDDGGEDAMSRWFARVSQLQQARMTPARREEIKAQAARMAAEAEQSDPTGAPKMEQEVSALGVLQELRI